MQRPALRADAGRTSSSRSSAAPTSTTPRPAKSCTRSSIEREEKNVLVVVIAGDKGFAGGFNSNVGKAAQKVHRRSTVPEKVKTSISSLSARRRSGFYKKQAIPPPNYEKN